jgi:hypothetical protein
VPGRHHSREHWSRVWDGARWLGGASAVAFILALAGDAPSLVQDEPSPPAPPAANSRPWRGCVPGGRTQAGREGAGCLADRVAAYMARLPHLAEGQGRDDVAYRFAAFLTRDLGLADGVALDWLRRWDAGNMPPKGPDALAEILANARRYGRRPVGAGLAGGQPGRSRHGRYTISFSVEVR